jgi:hypothetical protein
VDDFSSKLDLPRTLETVESIDANHIQMVKCGSREDASYRAISGVLRQFIRKEALAKQKEMLLVMPPADVAKAKTVDETIEGASG